MPPAGSRFCSSLYRRLFIPFYTVDAFLKYINIVLKKLFFVFRVVNNSPPY